MKILLLGSIGSGKSTQAQILADSLGLRLIRSGDLVREKALEDSEEGRICLEMSNSGQLVPDEIVIPMVKKKIQAEVEHGAKGFIFDGYIRRISQLEKFDPQYDMVVFLEVPQRIVKERLLGRERSDDTPEIIEQRLKVYHELTEPVITYYRDQGKLTVIDASGTVEEVTKNIEEHFKDIKAELRRRHGSR
ncbi:hypothetical protein A2631_04265 [Candidatus Daviesbacteria bacterium RIFCSPHIGHO2_01_FULL_44_29]|uniref:Adenylate kinase n=1 Tax=Candidatus Daviesbacteria bacterium RIFCSPHIGHO2_02_FULL_43_12 TaxID=1797776 RepID=A0A1F5KGF4_9BACT|nr:MAG: hypothetical protein A2631_04265 [Candidatus Daviesbacteria bacterium RIFCSPHIGHO2_01_FULL_44_29]OGE39939.1 MAG: hypothetical protein A3D25_03995 [Candidatus Daviesbacteria bacterium RIFCSPHIGHO2_02_FULL_43_12]OGE40503.1 MAG: hypothetical protein A3E86_00790 [Candidatus Daviesbacteria bacterium RIFCSPHIGHO2_12_FULL_47_45]OGE70380.1 MAG: hypothetical protein A3B55_01575 [Candidatus Daviesbacteria bacterium RIFCSPLOWO2_01_FULL_43_15]